MLGRWRPKNEKQRPWRSQTNPKVGGASSERSATGHVLSRERDPTWRRRFSVAKNGVQCDSEKIHIAACGSSGSGKSSLINAFRGLKNNSLLLLVWSKLHWLSLGTPPPPPSLEKQDGGGLSHFWHLHIPSLARNTRRRGRQGKWWQGMGFIYIYIRILKNVFISINECFYAY